ncbi:hypothetical protein Hypma_012861 [Hypsizygus marmoreus]|uniref:L-ornithine N(5)-oxygenase n=1 Tax=Hypsizygus marmoreus TaxID=39966 RepID=A0A369JCK5_HYPMA|nr:hypothetical protein Hypma_012861 [Hypsizygus marmoreus]
MSAINPDGVGNGFTFITDTALGQWYFHLAKDESGEWKAMIVFVTIQDLKGHEELGPELGIYNGHTLAWEDFHCERCRQIEETPNVLIVIAGKTGLNVAARFHKMKILATGTLGRPRVPQMLSSDFFHGTILHASEYNGAHQFMGKRVVVIGAGNTSADVCQDLAVHGTEGTMVQRSSPCVIAASSEASIISA